MGTNICVKGKGICKGVILLFQDSTLADDFLPFDLGAIDIILGYCGFKIRHHGSHQKNLVMKLKLGEEPH